MSKTYRPYEPDQMLLLPSSIKDWLPKGHLAHFVSDMVDELDLSAITTVYEREGRGYPPYHPTMMAKMLLYAYCVGLPSSRKIERGLVEDVALRYLGANNTPDFWTISDFRKRHLEALSYGWMRSTRRRTRSTGATSEAMNCRRSCSTGKGGSRRFDKPRQRWSRRRHRARPPPGLERGAPLRDLASRDAPAQGPARLGDPLGSGIERLV